MYKKKKRPNLFLIIFFSVVIIFILLYASLRLTRKTYIVENVFKTVSMSIEKVVVFPFTALNGKKNIDQSKSYTIQKNVNASLEKEIEELKSQLKLNSTLTEYDIINSTILSRNKSYWLNNITIDKGSHDGIKKDMAVVSSDGLIGSVSKTSFNSSEIKLLTSNDVNYKVSVSINLGENDCYAILSGYDKKKDMLKVTGIDKNANIEVGNRVLTSGMGTKFPRGIYIGEVSEVKTDKYNLSKTAYIKTKQDFNNIHYVTVLKEKKQ